LSKTRKPHVNAVSRDQLLNHKDGQTRSLSNMS